MVWVHHLAEHFPDLIILATDNRNEENSLEVLVDSEVAPRDALDYRRLVSRASIPATS
jgi:hypothetical protein